MEITPGPWRVGHTDKQDGFIDIESDDMACIATVWADDSGTLPEVVPSVANARLMASAPTLRTDRDLLFDACRHAMVWLAKDCNDRCEHDHCSHDELYDLLEHALTGVNLHTTEV